MTWSESQQFERQPLLSDGRCRTSPATYRSLADGAVDEPAQPLITRRAYPRPVAPAAQSSSSLIVRIHAICPDIHCPSCISHLSSLVASLDIHPSCGIAIQHADTSLIDRTVNIDLTITPTSSNADALGRAIAKRLIRIMKELGHIFAQDGFPVDHMRSRIIAGPQHHVYKDSMNQIFDAADFYPQTSSSTVAASFPESIRAAPRHRSFLRSAFPASLGNTFRSAWSRSDVQEDETARIQQERWAKHLQVCRACRAGDIDHPPPTQSASSTSDTPASEEDAQEGKVEDDSRRRTVAILSISGMTCSSCAQSITKAVLAEVSDVVDSIKVDALSASATVTAHPSALPTILEAIEDAGFDAQVVKTEPVRPPPAPASSTASPSQPHWRAKLAVHGMTCASCVQSITSALQSLADETNADSSARIVNLSVDLMAKSADILILTPDAGASGKTQVEARMHELIAHVEDVGFDAELLTLQLDSDNKAAGTQDGPVHRTARIAVHGMFCQSCVRKVRAYFLRLAADHPADLNVAADDLDAFTLTKPLLSFSYRSGSPSAVRLRTILAEINELDPTFDAQYAPPPSLASRSAVLARAELRDLCFRLGVAALFAVPALVISMIAPLLSPSSALRRYLSQYVVGMATRGEVAMWLIATPVQFGVGSLFFKKAWRSLSAMWKRRRSWTDRFLRFGNMDVLVALGTLVAYTSSLVFLALDASRTPQKGSGAEAEMGMTYFEVSVFLVLFILLGRVLEAVSKSKTGDAVAELGRMKPSSAQLVLDPSRPTDSRTERIEVDLLERGDLVLVPHGASPPLDGSFVGSPAGEQSGSLDESSLSGEARTVDKAVGDSVFAGTVNVSHAAVLVKIGVVPGACMIDEILDVVQQAAGKKASIAQLADAITGVFVPVIVYIALGVFVVWCALLYGVLSDEWQVEHVEHYGEPGARLVYALQFAISCLLVACPCGIGLAAPTSQLAGIGLASQHGILVNGGGEAFRAASKAAGAAAQLVVVLDKTGTITKGDAVKVVDSRSARDGERGTPVGAEQLLRCIELVEQGSTHPYAGAVRAWITSQLDRVASEPIEAARPHIAEVAEVAGKGVRASFDVAATRDQPARSFTLLIGNRALMVELDGAVDRMDSSMVQAEYEWSAGAQSIVYVGTKWHDGTTQDEIALALAISDEIRPEAARVIAHLARRYGAEVWMVSGDNAATARSVAAQVGIDPARVVAGVLPVEKKTWVERLASRGQDLEASIAPSEQRGWWRSSGPKERTVVFVGDGINDSPALSAANVGVALGSGSSIAHSSADFILLARTAPLVSIGVLLELSRATHRKIVANFAWAFVFNVSLVPIASGALVGVGITIGPALSGLAMAFSSTSVVLNSLALRTWKPNPDP